MTQPIRFIPAVLSDLDDAAAWYEIRKQGLGSEFIEEANRCFALAAENWQMHAIVYRNARQALLVRFPYAVYFAKEANRVMIYAVVHTARNPSVWQDRIP